MPIQLTIRKKVMAIALGKGKILDLLSPPGI
jgi:hypothetical protein